MRMSDRHDAQDRILSAVVRAASVAEGDGNASVADAIRELGASLARKYGLTNVPGLPKTFPTLHHSATSVRSADGAPS